MAPHSTLLLLSLLGFTFGQDVGTCEHSTRYDFEVSTCDFQFAFQNAFPTEDMSTYGLSNSTWTMSGSYMGCRKPDFDEEDATEEKHLHNLELWSNETPDISTNSTINSRLSAWVVGPLGADFSGSIILDCESPRYAHPRWWYLFMDNETAWDLMVQGYKRRMELLRNRLPQADLGLYGVGIATLNGIFSEPSYQSYIKASESGVFDNLDFVTPHCYMRGDNPLVLTEEKTRKSCSNALSYASQAKRSTGEEMPIYALERPIYGGLPNITLVDPTFAAIHINLMLNNSRVKRIAWWETQSNEPYAIELIQTLKPFPSSCTPCEVEGGHCSGSMCNVFTQVETTFEEASTASFHSILQAVLLIGSLWLFWST